MRDVHITDNSGGGLIEIVVIGGLIVLGASVLGSVAAAIAGALAALITAVMWAALGLAVLLVLIGVAWVALAVSRIHRGLPIRRPRHQPGVAWVQGRGQLPTRPAQVRRAPGQPELRGDQLSLDQATVEALADALARRAGGRS